MNFFRQWFTERDNATYCVVRALLTTGGIEMMVKFWQVADRPDWQGFAIGLGAIGAAIAAKNYSEK